MSKEAAALASEIDRSISAYLDDGRPSAQRVKKRAAAAKAGFQLIEK